MKMNASQEVPAPFLPSDLDSFRSALPDNAQINVATFTTGQRDPEITKYIFHATWEVK